MTMTKIDDDALDQVSGGTILRYLVQQGDSIQTIADRYHVTKEQVMKWNNIKNPDIIQVGQQIRILY